MADLRLNFRQTLSPQVLQRMVLVGRVKMAQAIEMPESEWAHLLSDIERDPLFKELVDARSEGRPIVRFKRFARTEISGQFYDEQDANVVGGSGHTPDALIDQKKHLLDLIKKVGQERFERYFLYREQGETLERVSQLCGVSADEVHALQDFVLDFSVQSEFYHPSALSSPNLPRPTVIGQIIRNDDGTFSMAYFSPHLARGLYEIDRQALRLWQKSKKLDRNGAARLKKYVGLLEMSNLRQGAFWRVMDYLLKVQKPFLECRLPIKMAPVSLRKAARDLQFAPSTISRVISTKSVLLPWGEEVYIAHLLPGQRRVVLNILESVLSEAKGLTDKALSRQIAETYGVTVSRRTITACRHVLARRDKKAA